jgi:S1-C subfamily serine protease
MVIIVVALVSAIATSVRLGVHASSRPAVSQNEVGRIVDRKVGAAVSNLQAAPADGVGVYAAVRPGLVVIQMQSPKAREPSGLGTGIVIDEEGKILTALHVVKSAPIIKVIFADGTESPASIATSDADHDVAVLTAEHLPEVVVPAVLGGGARVGDTTFAVGHPLGLYGSLSSGVISGLNRTFSVEGGPTLTGLIQFDAAVNPGNSGGPLLNRKGQVIGIVTGLANPAGDDAFVGIGFAVPIATAGRAAGAPGQ